MRNQKNILIAFFLNLFFSVFELIGGILTNSISILSDALHDFGDSLSIGLAFLFEKKSGKKADDKYTYGYIRYSVVGALITTVILLVGSIFIVKHAVERLINPQSVVSWGILVLAVVGIIINGIAVFVTSKGKNINEKAIRLHLIEDVLGWVIVLIGGIVMYFTNWYIIDPILSLILAAFILVNVVMNLIYIFKIFLQKAPDNFDVEKFREHLLEIEEIEDVYHIHVWTLDGVDTIATFHVRLKENCEILKEQQIKNILKEKSNEFGVGHTTIEIDKYGDKEEDCIDFHKNFNEHFYVSHHQHTDGGHDCNKHKH